MSTSDRTISAIVSGRGGMLIAGTPRNTVTEREIDQLLASWRARLELVAQNLVDLRAHPRYQQLAGPDRDKLTGITASRVLPALDSMSKLFEQFGELQFTISKA